MSVAAGTASETGASAGNSGAGTNKTSSVGSSISFFKQGVVTFGVYTTRPDFESEDDSFSFPDINTVA